MSKPVRSDADAKAELASAVKWYDEQRLGLGEKFLNSVRDCVERIGRSPGTFPLTPRQPEELGIRSARVARFPYSVVFIELTAEIRVLAFAHERRRPFYWRGRAP